MLVLLCRNHRILVQEHLKQQTLISGWPVTPGAIRKLTGDEQVESWVEKEQDAASADLSLDFTGE